MKLSQRLALGAIAVASLQVPANAAVLQYGDMDVMGTRSYPTDPRTGAILEGLTAGVVTFGAPEINHSYPFTPSGDDYLGTDQIYVGSNQTAFLDGYSGAVSRKTGPQHISLDYSPLVATGQVVDTLTLGIAADDFEFPRWGQAFTARINGTIDPILTAVLNNLSQTYPQTQFFTIGLSPEVLLASHVLNLEIDQGGNGADGWAIDFLTVGVATKSAAVPEPTTVVGLLIAGAAGLGAKLRQKRPSNSTKH